MTTRRLTTALTAALALAVLIPGPALAQEHHGGEEEAEQSRQQMMDRGMMDRPAMQRGMMSHGPMARDGMGPDHRSAMMAAMAFGPGPMMLLHQKEALGLSEEQASRLDSLRAAMHGTLEEHRSAMEEVHGAMKELAASEEPGMDRFRELLERMADAWVEMAVEMARTHRRAMDVLTEEQRSNARYGMELMHRMMMERHHGEGHGHMEDRGLMEDRGHDGTGGGDR